MKRLFNNIITILLILMFSQSMAFSEKPKILVNDELKSFKDLTWIKNEFIVKFKNSVSKDKIEKLNKENSTYILSKNNRGKFMRIKVPKGKSVAFMVEKYSKNKDVLYAEANYLATYLFSPNDTYYDLQWNFKNDGNGIKVESAWNITKGSPNIIVAVIDTGVAYKDKASKKYRGRLSPAYQKAPDFENTLFVDDSLMKDFINNDNEPLDDNSHGTHVAGTIAQSTNNAQGVAGIAHNTTIMPIKVLDSAGSGAYSKIADGIYFAADNGARVINLSLGGSYDSNLLREAVDYATSKGVILVCAAGNEKQNGNAISYPAAYDGCIAVGATRYEPNMIPTRSYYSNTGSYVDIVAPGGDTSVNLNGDLYVDGILQQTFYANPTDWYYMFFQGTSMAAPHVSAVVALLLAKNPNLSSADIKDAIFSTALDLGAPGKDDEYGHGLINTLAALNHISFPSLIHDVSISSVQIAPTIIENTINNIKVNVSNLGTFDETLSIQLLDVNNGLNVLLTTEGNISSNTTKEFNLSWNNAGIGIGNIDLKVIVLINEDANNFNNFLFVNTEIVEQGLVSSLSIDTINLTSKKQGRNSYVGKFNIVITDQLNIVKSGVNVELKWTFPNGDIQNQSSITDSNGFTKFTSKKQDKTISGKLQVQITDVILNNYIFDGLKVNYDIDIP